MEPPYSHAHVSETAIHREILRIYRDARAETRVVYNLGRDTERVEEENWVIRWMLWHVFRYRDNRNRNRRAPSSGNSGDNDDDDDERGEGVAASSRGKLSYSKRPRTSECGVKLRDPRLTAIADAPATSTSRYWDPVRNG